MWERMQIISESLNAKLDIRMDGQRDLCDIEQCVWAGQLRNEIDKKREGKCLKNIKRAKLWLVHIGGGIRTGRLIWPKRSCQLKAQLNKLITWKMPASNHTSYFHASSFKPVNFNFHFSSHSTARNRGLYGLTIGQNSTNRIEHMKSLNGQLYSEKHKNIRKLF